MSLVGPVWNASGVKLSTIFAATLVAAKTVADCEIDVKGGGVSNQLDCSPWFLTLRM